MGPDNILLMCGVLVATRSKHRQTSVTGPLPSRGHYPG
uniref:Uncharacterized protein n=1 Tax=Rhizophora mucronata TaxID=61149 RepID=A0A2P2QB78_RHIMU